MTLPSNIIFPLHTDKIFSLEPEEQQKQWEETIFTLQQMYEDIVGVVNGDTTYVEFDSNDQSQIIPTISGTTTAGVGTYGDREIWQLRNGLRCQIWFDIAWTAHTGTGNIKVDLPWEVALSQLTPFIGIVESDNIAFGLDYLTINCGPDSFDGNIIETGNAAPNAPIAMEPAGRLKGYVTYIGKEFD